MPIYTFLFSLPLLLVKYQKHAYMFHAHKFRIMSHTSFLFKCYSVVPGALRPHIIERKGGDGHRGGKALYKPPIHVDEIGLTSDKYIPLNASVTALPLKLSYSAMSLQRWLLMQSMEQSLSEQKAYGFTDKDIDDVRRLISDTSIYLLAVTMLASLLHLLFEFLAFQSDITFWAENKSLAGLSVRAVVSDLFSQIVIFLFLIESDTSVLVTIPAFISILIQTWKVIPSYSFCTIAFHFNEFLFSI
jgi:hypothetical protein